MTSITLAGAACGVGTFATNIRTIQVTLHCEWDGLYFVVDIFARLRKADAHLGATDEGKRRRFGEYEIICV